MIGKAARQSAGPIGAFGRLLHLFDGLRTNKLGLPDYSTVPYFSQTRLRACLLSEKAASRATVVSAMRGRRSNRRGAWWLERRWSG